ncbi:MAG: hypothetical protein LBK06_10100 [Planctomycetaceae bacterium]|jgi:predicted nucleic acid-binding protein|nr:hypothetical protein [Planctomycetaceae bacterium]
MKKINKVLQEIREVRQQFYQETKYMTVKERTEYRRQQREKIQDEIAKYGIRQMPQPPPTTENNQKVKNEKMKKTKIYLDTSVVSMLDDSALGILTKNFFELVKQKDLYELVVSPIVTDEIGNAKIEKREAIFRFVRTLNNLVELPSNEKSYDLAMYYVVEGILNLNHIEDLLHVAYASLYECDAIVSWNRKHIANSAKKQKLNFCNFKYGYHPIIICTPQYFVDNFGDNKNEKN